MRERIPGYWLRTLSGLSTNFSAAWFALVFIGPTVKVPQSTFEWLILTVNFGFGIVFLIITALIERGLEQYG